MSLQPDIPFVGRSEEHSKLTHSLKTSALTFVIGPAHAGKTALLQQVQSEAEQKFGYQCGYGACSSESRGLLRCVSDLYARWLKDARYREQVRTLWKLRRSGFPFGVARLVDEVFAVLERSGDLRLPFGARLFQMALRRTATVGEGFHNPLGMSPLSSKLAYDLVKIVSEVSGNPALIIIDDLERSGDSGLEIEQIRQFREYGARDIEVNIWLGCELGSEAASQLSSLSSSLPNTETILLGPLRLSEADERRLIDAVRSRIPVTEGVPTEVLLSLIDGFPGVLSWWWEAHQAGRLTSVEDLVNGSRDAHTLRYSSLRTQLTTLDSRQRRMAARVVLLPDVGSTLSLGDYASAVPSDFDRELFRELQESGVFDSDYEAPSFGHPSRYDAARDYFFEREDGRRLLSVQARELVRHLVSQLEPPELAGVRNMFYYEALECIGSAVRRLGMPEPYPTLCLFAAPTFLLDELVGDPVATSKRALATARQVPEGAVLIGNVIQTCLDVAALTKTIVEERAVVESALTLAGVVDSPLARYYAARCLVNSLPLEFLRGKAEHCVDLKRSILALRQHHPDEELLKEAYARFLRLSTAFTLHDRSSIEAYGRLFMLGLIDPRYEERATAVLKLASEKFVRGLFHSFPPGDEVVRAQASFKQLRDMALEAKMSTLVVVHFVQAARCIIDYLDSVAEKEAIIADLRVLSTMHREHELTQAALVYCLYRRMVHDLLRGETRRREVLLKEIRLVAWRFSRSWRILEYLFLALIDARDLSLSIAGELRWSMRYNDELVRYSTRNEIVRRFYAENRAGRAIDEIANGTASRAGLFLDELSWLKARFPEDEAVLWLWVVSFAELVGHCAATSQKGMLNKALADVKGENEAIRGRLIGQVRRRWGGQAARVVKRRLGRR